MTLNEDGNITSNNIYEPFGKQIPLMLGENTRLSFISKEKDIESYLGDFGVRKYDEEIGRFTSIDPLWEKYLGWSPYHYCGNNPIVAIDRGGDSVSVVISGTTLSSDNSSSYQDGIGGHIALNIDGNIYSFNGDGLWHTDKYNNYITNEIKHRGVTEFTLNVDQEQVQSYLNSAVNNAAYYDIEKSSCVTNTLSALQKGGLKVNKPNGVITVEQIFNEFEKSKTVTNKKEHILYTWSSFSARALYSVVRILNWFGANINPTGKPYNTKQILKD